MQQADSAGKRLLLALRRASDRHFPHDDSRTDLPPVTKTDENDVAALARLGETVRARLAADPSVHKVPVENAEIFAVGAFLSQPECQRLIALINAVARPSPVYDPESGGTYRTSYSGDIDPADSVVQMVERRICDLLGIDLSWGELVQGQRYQPGQQFHAHFDWFDPNAFYWPMEKSRGGQRSWTAMAYLNDVDEGGVTDFPDIGINIPPQAGALLIWNNARPDGTPNPAVVHAAKPVVRGAKYVVTKWFRTRPWG